MPISTYLSVGLSIIVLISNIVIFITIKFNDLVHLSKDVKEIKDTLTKFIERQHSLEKIVVKIDTRCKTTHKNK